MIKWLPALPRLVADFLQRDRDGEREQMARLLAAQQRTNRILTRAALATGGVLLGLVVVQLGFFLGYWG